MNVNPFEKYLSKEQVMHAEIVRQLANRFPEVVFVHTHNEGKKSPYEQYLFKKMGGLSGVSDFQIFEDSNFSKGMMLEIKWGMNVCSVAQVDFLIKLAGRGYTGVVAYDSADDVIGLIQRHMESGVGILPTEGILLVKGGKETVVPFKDAYKVLCKKTKEKAVKDKVKKLFQQKANARYGEAIKKVNAGKLFSVTQIEKLPKTKTK
jgi:hypothetical protein